MLCIPEWCHVQLAINTTVQDVHADIARGIRKHPGKLILSA